MRYPAADQQTLCAPRSHFRVIAVDVNDDTGVYQIGDFLSVEAARSAACERAGIGYPVFIYDDQAKLIERHGSWH